LVGSPPGLGGATRYIGGAGGTDSWYYNGLTGGSQIWAFGESAAMTLNSTGLGVGGSPSYKLDVNSGAVATIAKFTSNMSSGYIRFADSTAETGYIGNGSGVIPLAARTDFGIVSVGSLVLGSNNARAVTVDTSGNVGVAGIPTTRFEVFSGFIKNTATTGSAQIIAGNTGGVFTLAKDSSTGGNFTGTAYASVLYSDGAYPVCIFSNGSERMRIDSTGNVISNVTGTAPTLAANSQMVFNLTSNTNLRISVRGTDGTTRTANITLA
jgi:hypothetical protein